MLERFKSYFKSLERLSGTELDRSAEKLVAAEKRNVAKLIAHIAEMSRRKVALELGYKHLFDYCVRRLRLSEGSVALRIQVANAAREFPQLLVALAANRLSLTVAGLVVPHLTAENVEKVLTDCEGLTKRDAEEYLVALRPKPVFKPSIRKQPSRPVETQANSDSPHPAPHLNEPPSPSPPTPGATAGPPKLLAKAEGRGESPPPPAPRTILQPAEPEVFNFRFAADRSFKDKFERLAEVLGVENAQKHMAEILEQALDVALDKKDPKKKLERRRERKQKESKTESCPDELASSEPEHVTSEVRERVFASADYQCEYKSEDGTRCCSRTGLQIEHTRPFGIYRSHDERFLRAFCRAHNLLAAEKVYGIEFIQAKIDESRSQRASVQRE